MSSIYACILAEVEAGQSFEAAQYLSRLDSVGMVVPTTGPYDLMIIAKCDDASNLGKTVITEFQSAPGIRSTLTMLILGDLELRNWLSANS